VSSDQKIMDKFVEQTQEILVLKDLNRKLKIENDRCKEIAERDGKDYSDVVRKLKIAVEALKFYANKENYESNDINRNTNNKVYDIVLFDFDRNLEPKKDFAGSKARQAIKQIEGSIEKE